MQANVNMKKSRVVKGYELMKTSEKNIEHAVELSRKIKSKFKNGGKPPKGDPLHSQEQSLPEQEALQHATYQPNAISSDGQNAPFSRLDVKMYR